MQRILPVTPYKLCSTVWEPLWDLCWRSPMGNEWFCRVWIIVHFSPRANISWVNSSRVCSCPWQGNHSLPCGRCLERGVVQGSWWIWNCLLMGEGTEYLRATVVLSKRQVLQIQQEILHTKSCTLYLWSWRSGWGATWLDKTSRHAGAV